MNKKPKNSLKIKIEADVAKCVKGLDLVQKRLDGIESSIKRLAAMNVNVQGVISGKDLFLTGNRGGNRTQRLA